MRHRPNDNDDGSGQTTMVDVNETHGAKWSEVHPVVALGLEGAVAESSGAGLLNVNSENALTHKHEQIMIECSDTCLPMSGFIIVVIVL